MTQDRAVVDPDRVVEETRAWVRRAVIGLRLCPFAQAPEARGLIRYVLSRAETPQALRADLERELIELSVTPADEIETTLLVHPGVLTDFADYNDFLDEADALVAELGLEGVVQIASFHPDYQFAGSSVSDIANATNRSPYPLLHLLREDSVERVVAAFPGAADIFEANIATLEILGPKGWADLRQNCTEDAHAAGHPEQASSSSHPGKEGPD